ncbi:Uncharacterized OsmC-related protein [Bowdeniella nasicola]|uniref:Uncharacterized OsmC-related protein n=1 Tax=Bowdeniella nasicola TaxID=208480 RepID=A0A1H4DIY9_9ACTO|nr:OsmC family protein [Bowdeniella nasicola]SEA72715.1 Uncharacterized OsmC-related protein [Bowdeniella nasicola]
MTTESPVPAFPTEPTDSQHARPPISLRRLGTRTFVATAPRGQQLTVGPADVPGAITPGELLQIALAGCNAMSADARMSHALGEDHDSTWWVRAIFEAEGDEYVGFDVVADADLSALDSEEETKLAQRAAAAIARLCTVGHTLEGNPVTTLTVGGQVFKE